MPEWLLKQENYTSSQVDKDTFIERSILSLLHMISRIRTQSSYPSDLFHVHPVYKVLFTCMLAVILSLSRNFAFIMVIQVYLLVILSLMKAEEIIRILRASCVVAFLTMVILIPAAFWGYGYNTVMITSKVFATVMAVNILSHSTRWSSITGALKCFFIPDLFILVLDIAITYILMLGHFSLYLFYSLKLRSVGRNKQKYASLAGIAGTTFIKSKEMAEDMYAAMECRGFTGEYRTHRKWKMTLADWIYILINIGILFLFVYMGRI